MVIVYDRMHRGDCKAALEQCESFGTFRMRKNVFFTLTHERTAKSHDQPSTQSNNTACLSCIYDVINIRALVAVALSHEYIGSPTSVSDEIVPQGWPGEIDHDSPEPGLQ